MKSNLHSQTVAVRTTRLSFAMAAGLVSRAFTLFAALWLGLSANSAHGTPAGKTQNLTSPDQVPEGLARSDWQNIRAAYEAGRHAFVPVADGWQARNPGQQWTTKFDRRGFLAEPQGGGWTWGLELQSYGFGEKQTAIGGTPAVRADGTRLSYQWDAAVQEWFINDARGLEHGFTIKERPAAAPSSGASPAPLAFLLATRGSLHPRVSADALAVAFEDASGATVLNYSGLKVWDADGRTLGSRFEAAGENRVRLLVDERGARYPLTIDPIAQQAYLKASNTGAGDQFAYSVAVSGDTVVVGAPREASNATGVNGNQADNSLANAGAAYVFVRNGTMWSQQAYLKASQVTANDQFGTSVTISGDTLVVGAPMEDSSTTGVNTTPNESAANSGAAYVFVRSGTTWSEQAYLKPVAVGTTQAGDQFGISVAISGDAVVVGANQEDSSSLDVDSTPNESAADSGAAYVFVRSGTIWSQQGYLKPAAVGTTQAGDQFGISVAVSGVTVVVGANREDSSSLGVNSTSDESATDSGAAYVFTRTGTTWSQQAYLKPASVGTTQVGDFFGFSVAVSGDTVVVGAYQEDGRGTGANSTPADNGINNGAAYVFTRSVTTWTQQAYLKSSIIGANQDGNQFGFSVGVSGDTLVVGATREASSSTGVNSTPNGNAANSGAAFVFVRSGTAWAQSGYLKPAAVGTTQVGDFFGWSVSVSGDKAVVGAVFEDSSSLGVDSTPNEGAADSGAAYVFNVPATITSVTGPAVGAYKAGQTLSFTVTFSVPVTVTGTPLLSLIIGSSPVNATYASGSGGAALVFTYIVQAGDTDTDGIAAGSPLMLNGGTISTIDGPATLTFTSQNMSGVLVDNTPPTVVSVVRLNPSAQALASGTPGVVFRVTYSEPVTNVEAAGFAVVGVNGGTVTGTIGPITGGPTVYDVTVNITGGSGEFRLNVVN